MVLPVNSAHPSSYASTGLHSATIDEASSGVSEQLPSSVGYILLKVSATVSVEDHRCPTRYAILEIIRGFPLIISSNSTNVVVACKRNSKGLVLSMFGSTERRWLQTLKRTILPQELEVHRDSTFAQSNLSIIMVSSVGEVCSIMQFYFCGNPICEAPFKGLWCFLVNKCNSNWDMCTLAIISNEQYRYRCKARSSCDYHYTQVWAPRCLVQPPENQVT